MSDRCARISRLWRKQFERRNAVVTVFCSRECASARDAIYSGLVTPRFRASEASDSNYTLSAAGSVRISECGRGKSRGRGE